MMEGKSSFSMEQSEDWMKGCMPRPRMWQDSALPWPLQLTKPYRSMHQAMMQLL